MNVWIQNPFDNLPLEGFRKQRYWLMAEAFVRAGHSVVLWTSDFNHTTKSPRQIGKLLEDECLEVRLVPTRPYSTNVGVARIVSHWDYANAWTRLAGKEGQRRRPDLIVTSTPTLSGASAALRLGRQFGARVVVDVMDAWPETFERLAPWGLRGLARLALVGFRCQARRIYREADNVTGVCDRYRELTGRDDFYRAYHGIDLSGRCPLVGRTASLDGLRLAYVGNLGRTYDLGTVIRGVKELGARLEIAGKGPCEGQWHALVKELGLEDSVTFHGYLSENALADLLASCDMGVVPMPAESFVGVPYKFADYAAAGLPVVSSLGGESEALLLRHRCGAGYVAGDSLSFVAAVRHVRAIGVGDVKGLREVFDAVRIYDAYVAHVV